MMTLEEQMDWIESASFSAIANIASSDNTLINIFENDETIRYLESLDDKIDIFIKSLILSCKTTDDNFENPYDTALAAYLYIIRNDKHYEETAKFVLADRRPNWFWAKKIAVRFLGKFDSTSFFI